MKQFKHNIIQLNVALTLMGYWFISALFGMLVGETTSSVSIGYRLLSVMISFVVIFLCKNDIYIEKRRSIFVFYAFVQILYTLRILIDIIGGPFAAILPTDVFMKDLIYIVGGIFTPVFSIIISRKYLDIELITRYVYWLGLFTIIMVLYTQSLMDIAFSYEEERMDGGRGLGTLALVKIGAIELLAAIHLMMNGKHKYLYIIGAVLGAWLVLASGSRGGLVALIVALGYSMIVYSKKNILLNIIVIAAVVLMVVNIIPIMEWLASYFPVVSERLLMSILENDQSGRAELRAQAMELITTHPFFGYSYRLGDSLTGYGCHNGLLDIMLALGIPIGLLFVYFIYIKSVILLSRMIALKALFFPSVLCLFAIIHTLSGSGITNNVFGTAVCLMAVSYYYVYPTFSKYHNGH